MKANRHYRADDEAVSPVIAVILMVAITVVLSATVYAWVSGFGGNHNQPANAITLISNGPLSGSSQSFTVASADSDLRYSSLTFTLNGVPISFGAGCAAGNNAVCRGASPLAASTPVQAGDTVWITGAAAGDTLRIVDTQANAVLFTTRIG